MAERCGEARKAQVSGPAGSAFFSARPRCQPTDCRQGLFSIWNHARRRPQRPSPVHVRCRSLNGLSGGSCPPGDQRFFGRFQILWASQAAGGLAAQRASNSTQRATNHHADRTTGRDADDGAGGCAGHRAAAYQHRLGFALGLPRLQRELCCGGWILRGNAESGSGLLGARQKGRPLSSRPHSTRSCVSRALVGPNCRRRG